MIPDMPKQPFYESPGRPRLFRKCIRATITLDYDEHAALKRLGQGKVSEGVREALRLSGYKPPEPGRKP